MGENAYPIAALAAVVAMSNGLAVWFLLPRVSAVTRIMLVVVVVVYSLWIARQDSIASDDRTP